jgi:ParB-like chromosome segregation protein Spo0J
VRRRPSFQLFPDMDPEAFSALKADIAARGVLVPVELDQDATVLDGHHRVRAWNELRRHGVRVPQYPRNVRQYRTDDERLATVLRLNTHRRQMGPKQRRELVQRLRREGWSTRRIADVAGFSKSTVDRDCSGVPNGTPERVLGADGKRYRVVQLRRPPSILAMSEREERQAVADLTELGNDAPERTMTAARAATRARQHRLDTPKIPDGSSVAGRLWRIDNVRIEELEVEDHSVDLILTDPPYTSEGLHLYEALSAFAARKLKREGLLIAYLGNLELPRELAPLGEHLEWVGQGAIFQPGRHSTIRSRMLRTAHRPFAVYSNGPRKPRGWLCLTIEARKVPSKDLHPWQQALEPFERLVRDASRPGELVVDPFVGSGTSGVAAIRLGRRFVGGDIDPRAVATATRRLRSEEAAHGR